MKKIIFTISLWLYYTSLFVFSANTINAQTKLSTVMLFMDQTGPYKVIDKSNWSRYDNGKYIGHVYREVRASIVPQSTDTGKLLYQGNFFVLEETLRDMIASAQELDAIIPVSFEMYRDGNIKIENDYGFPTLRGFPSYPVGEIVPGTKWTAPGVRAADPLNTGRPVLVPILAEYEYKGIETYKEVPVHRIASRYASRYRGNGDITNISGTHSVDILVRVSDGLPLMMRDTMDETFTFPGGYTVRFRGFTLSFGESSVPLNREAIITSINEDLFLEEDSQDEETFPQSGDPQGDWDFGTGPFSLPNSEAVSDPDFHIQMTNVPEGIKLTINDLRFVADSDELLPEENIRLEKIADILQTIPDRFLLIEGHTAAVGRPEGEMELSIQRAKKITDELSSRGIAADRFIYKGWGGTKPLGNNNTDAGRQLNRRVEITILE
ncbi:MAG: OmpA family protein [Treponema sp.]|jgi:outer membrane protein OmpA-like peptidoglycan-associated protein|nr:OmpA family protein [Treponema sp.]